MELFRKDQNLIDTLLPELTGEEAPAIFGHNKWVPVHKALRYMVLREFTTGVRRTDCLESMGLAQVVYEGVDAREQGAAGVGRGRWGSRPRRRSRRSACSSTTGDGAATSTSPATRSSPATMPRTTRTSRRGC